MIKLLCRLFVKDADNVASPEVRRRYGTLVSTVGILLNIVLCLGKLLAGWISGSVAMTADALNNLSDAGAQIISLISFKISSKPADRDHPFGHARIEYVASLIVSFLILTIGVELLRSSLEKLIHPRETEFSLVAVIILGVSVLVKLWLCLFNRVISRRIGSKVMEATSADSLSDAGATAAVLVSTLILKFFGVDIDAYMGIAVAVFILVAGGKLLLETNNLLLGEAPDEEVVESIKRVVSLYPEALGIHDLVVHNYGPHRTIASLHVEVDGPQDVFHTHDVIDNIERQLVTELGISCTIHMDPIVTNDEEVTALREGVSALITEIDGAWKIHDFRFVKGDTHRNLIFDVVVPFECKLSDGEIARLVNERIKRIGEDCFAVITVDKE